MYIYTLLSATLDNFSVGMILNVEHKLVKSKNDNTACASDNHDLAAHINIECVDINSIPTRTKKRIINEINDPDIIQKFNKPVYIGQIGKNPKYNRRQAILLTSLQTYEKLSGAKIDPQSIIKYAAPQNSP